MDDDLRLAIDRLVRSGGRLTLSGASGASLVLDQPGIRFGILEVKGRLTVPDAESAEAVAASLPTGWTDPAVTQRLGREIRLQAADSTAGGPWIRSRTWRVPPALASEIVNEVRTALGELTGLDFEPVATRELRSPVPAVPAGPTSGGHPTAEVEADDDRADQHRVAARTVPAPVRAVAALALVAVIAFAWAGMIRGAPRVPLPSSAQQPSGAIVVAAPSVASSTPLEATPEPPPATTAPPPALPASFASHLVGSSSEGAGPASAAIDGDPVTAWHAAFGTPQWIEIALDTPSTVTEILALIAQSEPGITRHTIQVAQGDGVLHLLGIVDRKTDDHELIRFNPATPIENVERIRIETLDSPSNVGWYEVVIR